jgi:hypothetical protein
MTNPCYDFGFVLQMKNGEAAAEGAEGGPGASSEGDSGSSGDPVTPKPSTSKKTSRVSSTPEVRRGRFTDLGNKLVKKSWYLGETGVENIPTFCSYHQHVEGETMEGMKRKLLKTLREFRFDYDLYDTADDILISLKSYRENFKEIRLVQYGRWLSARAICPFCFELITPGQVSHFAIDAGPGGANPNSEWVIKWVTTEREQVNSSLAEFLQFAQGVISEMVSLASNLGEFREWWGAEQRYYSWLVRTISSNFSLCSFKVRVVLITC